MIAKYDLFLFDFDGLLVNTEELHYRAYGELLSRHGATLGLDFPAYAAIALTSADGLRRHIAMRAPHLDAEWESTYAEKKQIYLELLMRGAVELMPGASEFLEQLGEKRRCVVTNSPRMHIDAVRKARPELDLIPHWITREDYAAPKPAPDGYLLAQKLYGKPGDRVIGFEDSLRGTRSLIAAGVTPVVIAPAPYPELGDDVLQVTSFHHLISKDGP